MNDDNTKNGSREHDGGHIELPGPLSASIAEFLEAAEAYRIACAARILMERGE
jgi:hypothetical protein